MPIAWFLFLVSLGLSPTPAIAQVPTTAPKPAETPKPKPWSGSVSAGLSITSGNRNTQNFNVSFETVRDTKARNVLKIDGLYLRGKSESNVTGDQLRLGGRDQYTFDTRGFVFAQARYMRDRFKRIDYLIAPAAGVGLKLVNKPNSAIDIAAGIGGVWEQNSGNRLPASGSITLDEKLSHKLSNTATITQSLSALWKTTNLRDSLYTLNATLAAGISKRAQLKVELLDSYKSKPPSNTIKRNDVTVITGLVYRF